ncbi:MAG: ACP S-malonyltransferase [Alphaproteobacteria bacterium]
MRRTAFLCPGQGAQHVGMGRDVCEAFPVARRAFEEVDEALGESLSRLCFEGPDERLVLTENTQPALLATSVAIGRVLETETGRRPVIAAGHSLGEWSALVLAGAVDLARAVRAVRERGRLMQQAVAPGEGAMSALLGADVARVQELCAAASDAASGEVVVPANLNGAGQVAVAGHAAAVERLESLAREAKVRSMRLRVSAPFHSPLMRPARDRMEPVLAAIAFRDPEPPVIGNVDGRPHAGGGAVAGRLLEQITSAVRWEDCARAVAAACDLAVEVGPGKVLTGLMKRISPETPCIATGDLEGVRAAIEEMAR